jgi:hypothetical protein
MEPQAAGFRWQNAFDTKLKSSYDNDGVIINRIVTFL